MTVNAGHMLRITRHFEASPERVFDAWLNPETAGNWLFTTATGEMTRVEIDPRVGGKYLLIDRRHGKDIEHVGEYLEINRPTRLVFTFTVSAFSPQSTRVTIDIVPAGKGCDLTLTHEGVLEEWVSQTQQGWTMILDGLANSLDSASGGYGVIVEPGTVRFRRILPGPIERVWAYLTESDKRAKWLAAGEMEPRAGTSLELRFDHDSLSRDQSPVPERFREGGCGAVTSHEVVRCEPPRLLTLTWGGGAADEPSEVTFELIPQGDKVLLVLTHRRLAGRTMMVDVASGWHSHLALLTERVNGQEPAASFWKIFSAANAEYEKQIPAK
jgi:uncharacterized protein YndB with AHSA1/START domain